MLHSLQENELFVGMKQDEISRTLACAKAHVRTYEKNNVIFSQMDPPSSLYVLMHGSVIVCKDSLEGKRYIVTTIRENEVFGEVFVFLEQAEYAYYVIANEESSILEIPKEYFYHACARGCDQHAKITYNLLSILARKAFFLNNKVQLLTSGNLRQKIVKHILDHKNDQHVCKLSMNREQFADYLNVTRPSLSRELIKMAKEGLIELKRDEIGILDLELFSSHL